MIQDECDCLLGNNHAEWSKAKKIVPQESEHVCVDEWFPTSASPHSLVSTYVVCERLSVMHEPAGVVEILVQILQNTPILKYSFRIAPPPPKNENCQRSWHFDFSVSEYPPPLPPPLKIEI